MHPDPVGDRIRHGLSAERRREQMAFVLWLLEQLQRDPSLEERIKRVLHDRGTIPPDVEQQLALVSARQPWPRPVEEQPRWQNPPASS